MNNLITLSQGTIGEAQVQTVNARDLHSFLEVGTAFKDWISRRIADYAFEKGKDFCSFLSESQGGRPAKDYHLTLDMAKELSMVERNEKGKQARQYFIECERQVKQVPVNSAALSRMQLIQLAMEAEQEKLQLEARVAELAPKVEVHDRIADAEGSLTLRETANTLRIPERKFVLWLQQHDWVYRRAGHKSLLGYADKVKAGYLYLKQTPIRDVHTGEERLSEQVRVTPLGLTVLGRRLSDEAKQVDMPMEVIARNGNVYANVRR